MLPVAEVKKERIDVFFRLVDESLLHLEFQTTARAALKKGFAPEDVADNIIGLSLEEVLRKKRDIEN